MTWHNCNDELYFGMSIGKCSHNWHKHSEVRSLGTLHLAGPPTHVYHAFNHFNVFTFVTLFKFNTFIRFLQVFTFLHTFITYYRFFVYKMFILEQLLNLKFGRSWHVISEKSRNPHFSIPWSPKTKSAIFHKKSIEGWRLSDKNLIFSAAYQRIFTSTL